MVRLHIDGMYLSRRNHQTIITIERPASFDAGRFVVPAGHDPATP